MAQTGCQAQAAIVNPKKEQRQNLRNCGTSAEAVLWKCLQRRQMLGRKFRRQESVGPYIVDFYSPECGLVVELDGAPHLGITGDNYDAERTTYLERIGYKVIRFENKLVHTELEFVLERIREEVRERAKKK
jgi:very-short-patch-repair endonuclease